MDNKQQRVAAVTGAAGGLGLGIAQRLARAGYRVIAIDRASHVEEAAAALRGQGLQAQAVVLDIADEAAVKKMVADVDAQHGRFDILVNNAGIHPKIDGERNSFLKMTTAQWNEVIGDSMRPGAMQLAVMPSAATSDAMMRVMPIIPALAAA